MTQRRERFVNCYLCGQRHNVKEVTRRPKSMSGEALLWCSKCLKRQFPNKVKLIKRSLPQWHQD